MSSAYLDRHDRVVKMIIENQELRQKLIELSEIVLYYEYNPTPVCKTDVVRVYWNRKVQTARPIPNSINYLGLTIKKRKKTIFSNSSKNYVERIMNTLLSAMKYRTCGTWMKSLSFFLQ